MRRPTARTTSKLPRWAPKRNPPPPCADDGRDRLFAMQRDIEQIDAAVEQQDAIQQTGGEAAVLAPTIGRRRPTAQHAREIIQRCRARPRRKQEEISTGWQQQQLSGWPTDAQSDPDSQPDQRQRAAFATRRPFLPRGRQPHHRVRMRSVPDEYAAFGAARRTGEGDFASRFFLPADGQSVARAYRMEKPGRADLAAGHPVVGSNDPRQWSAAAPRRV